MGVPRALILSRTRQGKPRTNDTDSPRGAHTPDNRSSAPAPHRSDTGHWQNAAADFRATTISRRRPFVPRPPLRGKDCHRHLVSKSTRQERCSRIRTGLPAPIRRMEPPSAWITSRRHVPPARGPAGPRARPAYRSASVECHRARIVGRATQRAADCADIERRSEQLPATLHGTHEPLRGLTVAALGSPAPRRRVTGPLRLPTTTLRGSSRPGHRVSGPAY